MKIVFKNEWKKMKLSRLPLGNLLFLLALDIFLTIFLSLYTYPHSFMPKLNEIVTNFSLLFRTLIPVIFIINYFKEYQQKTIRAILVRPISKIQFLLSKFFTIVLYTIIAEILICVISFILTSTLNEFEYTYFIHYLPEFIVNLTNNFLQTIYILCLILLISVIFQSMYVSTASVVILFILNQIMNGSLYANTKVENILAFSPFGLTTLANPFKQNYYGFSYSLNSYFLQIAILCSYCIIALAISSIIFDKKEIRV